MRGLVPLALLSKGAYHGPVTPRQSDLRTRGDICIESLYSTTSHVQSDEGDVIIGDAHGVVNVSALAGLVYIGKVRWRANRREKADTGCKAFCARGTQSPILSLHAL